MGRHKLTGFFSQYFFGRQNHIALGASGIRHQGLRL
jgi:hypothetical protein